MHPIEIFPWSEFNKFQAFPSELIETKLPLDGIAVVNMDLLRNNRRSILMLSRLPKRVNSEDHWLNAIRATVKEAAALGEALVVGYGQVGWDYTAWYAAKLGMPIVVVLRPRSLEKMQKTIGLFLLDLDINPNAVTFVMALTEARISKHYKFRLRDQMAFSLAHRRFPVCLRHQSSWKEIWGGYQSLDYRHQVPYPLNFQPEWLGLRQISETEELHRIHSIFFHWTRGKYAPWKGETQAQYFAELTAAKSGNPRDGFHTLMKITSESLIRGEARMNRHGESAVSFTSLGPFEAIKLMRYRTTLGHWTFEPYGIEFSADDLKSAGISPAIYGDDEDYERLPADQKAFFQYRGDPQTGTSWADETEWRLRGGLDFSHLRDRVVIWTPSKAEASELHRLTGLSTTSFEEQLGRSART